jgi:hypothetical protein
VKYGELGKTWFSVQKPAAITTLLVTTSLVTRLLQQFFHIPAGYDVAGG